MEIKNLQSKPCNLLPNLQSAIRNPQSQALHLRWVYKKVQLTCRELRRGYFLVRLKHYLQVISCKQSLARPLLVCLTSPNHKCRSETNGQLLERKKHKERIQSGGASSQVASILQQRRKRSRSLRDPLFSQRVCYLHWNSSKLRHFILPIDLIISIPPTHSKFP